MTRLILKILLVFMIFATGWLAHEHVESNDHTRTLHRVADQTQTIHDDLVARQRHVESMPRSHQQLVHALDQLLRTPR